MAECNAYLTTELFGGAPITKIEIGLTDIFIYYPFGHKAKQKEAADGALVDVLRGVYTASVY